MLENRTREVFEMIMDQPSFITLAPARAYPFYLANPDKGLPLSLSLHFYHPTRMYYERMLDEASGSKKDWHNCEHYKCFVNMSAYHIASCDWSTLDFGLSKAWVGKFPSHYIVSLFEGYHAPIYSAQRLLYLERSDGGFVPPPDNLDELVSTSFRKMLPAIKDELSLINSVIELKDFSSLPKTLTKIADVLPRLKNLALTVIGKSKGSTGVSRTTRRYRTTFRKEFGPTLSELLRASADGYLQASFNILPLLSDIAGIYTALSRTQERVRTLVARQNKLQIRHFTRSVPLPIVPSYSHAFAIGPYTVVSNPGGEPVYDGHALGMLITENVIEASVKFHAEIEFSYHFTRFQAENAQLLGLLDALGVNLNPSIIWNAIPWSFMVDWVFGVSRWLNDRKVLNLSPVTNITRYLWSATNARVIRRSFQTYQTGADMNSVLQTYLPDVLETSFRRDVGIPESNSVILSELSNKELSLGVALAITRKKRKNRGR